LNIILLLGLLLIVATLRRPLLVVATLRRTLLAVTATIALLLVVGLLRRGVASIGLGLVSQGSRLLLVIPVRWGTSWGIVIRHECEGWKEKTENHESRKRWKYEISRGVFL